MTTPARRDDRSLHVATLVMVAIWCPADLVFGAADVFTTERGPESLDLTLLGVIVFTMGVNVLLAALITGGVSLWRTSETPVASIVLFATVLVAGVVGSFALSDWSVGDSNTVVTTSELHVRGLGIWGLAILVFGVCFWLLRPTRPVPLDQSA